MIVKNMFGRNEGKKEHHPKREGEEFESPAPHSERKGLQHLTAALFSMKEGRTQNEKFEDQEVQHPVERPVEKQHRLNEEGKNTTIQGRKGREAAPPTRREDNQHHPKRGREAAAPKAKRKDKPRTSLSTLPPPPPQRRRKGRRERWEKHHHSKEEERKQHHSPKNDWKSSTTRNGKRRSITTSRKG